MKIERKVKQPSGAPQPIVIQSIEVRPWNRVEQDIPNWRRAVQSAESQIPRRSLLYSLYADVVLDAQVEAAMGKRVDAVLDTNWQFVDKAGKPVDAINSLIDTIGFTDILEEIIAARFWGYSILEPTFWKDEDERWHVDAGMIPRLNYRPELGIVAFDINGNEGIDIRSGIYVRTVMEVGKVKDLGLLMKAAPYQILKRGGLGDYANFIQVFGHPFIDATWDGFDEKQRQELKIALDNLGAGGSIIRPVGTNIEIKENNTTASGDAQEKFLTFLNREISKALLGTTETIESSSSSGFAQSKTHAEGDNMKQGNDIAYVRRVLNSSFVKILKSHGFDVAGGSFVIQGEDNELTQVESFEIHKALAIDIGLPIGDDFWYETYGVPKPDNAEAIRKARQLAQTAADPPQKNENEPTAQEDDGEAEVQLAEIGKFTKFLKNIKDFFVEAPVATTGAMPEKCGCRHTIDLAEIDTVDTDSLISRAWDFKGEMPFDARLFWDTSKALNRAFKDGWQEASRIELVEAPGFVYGVDDPALISTFEQNIFRFSGTKTLAEVELLNRLFRRSKNFNEFFQLAKSQLDTYNRDWLQTEFTTALLTGESAATFNRLMSQRDIFPFWEYRTIRDGRVRPWHEALDGIVLPANDPLWRKIFPPNGWNCRCRILPRLKGEVNKTRLRLSRQRAEAYIASDAFTKEANQGFGINKGMSGEVFAENQLYIKRFPGVAETALNKLTAADFEMLKFIEARKIATANVPVFDGNSTAFLDELETLGGERVLRDFSKKPIVVTRSNVVANTTVKAIEREHRISHLRAAKEATAKPDEVWLQGKKFQDAVYLKYYNDDTAVAIGSIEGGKLVLKRWFLLNEVKATPEEIRKGLVIFRR